MRNGDVDCRLLEESGLLDVTSYCAAARLEAGADAARHYLLDGWRAGLEPNPDFEGGFLYPYYRSAGLDGPPALTYLMLQAAGWPVYSSRAQAQQTADVSDRVPSSIPPATRHERAVSKASTRRCTTSSSASNGARAVSGLRSRILSRALSRRAGAAMNLLAHYLAHGPAEGRRGMSVADTLTFDRQRLDPSRETILLIVHDASRTGAPIIAYNIALRLRQKYNVVAVLLAAGDLFTVSRPAALPWSDRSRAPIGTRRKPDIS